MNKSDSQEITWWEERTQEMQSNWQQTINRMVEDRDWSEPVRQLTSTTLRAIQVSDEQITHTAQAAGELATQLHARCWQELIASYEHHLGEIAHELGVMVRAGNSERMIYWQIWQDQRDQAVHISPMPGMRAIMFINPAHPEQGTRDGFNMTLSCVAASSTRSLYGHELPDIKEIAKMAQDLINSNQGLIIQQIAFAVLEARRSGGDLTRTEASVLAQVVADLSGETFTIQIPTPEGRETITRSPKPQLRLQS